MVYDVIIIGSGPAGLSSVIYAQRAMLKALVIEKLPMSGGQILNTEEIDNYAGMPGMAGFDMGMKFREHADKLGATFAEGNVVRVDVQDKIKKVHTEDGTVYETKTVILANGAEHAKMGVKGEEEFGGRGVSYCATCDGAFYRNKVTAVFGGGDVAVEDAIFLSRICTKVYLVHRRDQLRAAKVLQEEVLHLDNVEVIWDHELQEITGEGKVEKVIIKNKKDDSLRELTIDGVFIGIGMAPQTAIYKDSGIALDERGYIIAGEDCTTNVPGVFVAGDVRTKQLRQVITACADGAVAITNIERYLIENK
ncbi:MAG: thioredoxin-disulfide reductase [Eubacteriales bacterium]|nr:thioredoxin-disulfide reductase [Eubacteriales bacterium]